MPIAPSKATGTKAIFGSYVLVRRDGKPSIVRDQWVITENDRIVSVSPSRPANADYVSDRPGRFILPGLLNLHNHCFSEAVARTHSEDGGGRKNNQSIVYSVLLPLTKRGIDILSPEERLAIGRLGILQLLKGGATTVMEPFRNGIPEMFDAALEMGLRFYGAPYLFSSSDPKTDTKGAVQYNVLDASGRDSERELSTWNSLHARWHGLDDDRIQVTMSPHATDTCDPDLLRAAHARAMELGVQVTTHLAQSDSEVEIIKQRYGGRTPTEYLDWLGLLTPDLLAAHCISCSDSDLDLMAKSGMTVLNCPRVFARTGKTAAFARFAAKGIRTVVGTDGYNMDLLGEINAAAMISKVVTGDPTVATAPDLIDAITYQAAGAVARTDLGEIRSGAKADLTVVDLSHPHLQPLFDPIKALVWLANRANIDTVMVDGRILIEENRYTLGDETTITQAGTTAIQKIWDLPEARAAFAA